MDKKLNLLSHCITTCSFSTLVITSLHILHVYYSNCRMYYTHTSHCMYIIYVNVPVMKMLT